MLSVADLNDLIFLLRRVVVHGEHQDRLVELEQKLQRELAKQKQVAV